MAENRSEKAGKKKVGYSNRENRKFGDDSLLIGIGIGAILLVLAGIVCILGEIYYMLSSAGSIAVIIISGLLLLSITGIFLYIMRNTLLKKIEEERQAYERLLRMNKVAYGKMEERDEKLYKRQVSVAKVQIKRTRESVMNMVRANEYIIDVIEEKLGEDSVLSSYGVALNEIQESVAQLRELCERIAEGQLNVSVSEELPETTEILPEPKEEAPELEEILLEEEEPVGVEIEPLPEEILENIGDIDEPKMETMMDTLVPEPEELEIEEETLEPEALEMEEELPEPEALETEEELPEPEALEMEEELPEPETLEIEEEAPEPETEMDEEEPEEDDKDTGQPMSMEDIAALFNNL